MSISQNILDNMLSGRDHDKHDLQHRSQLCNGNSIDASVQMIWAYLMM